MLENNRFFALYPYYEIQQKKKENDVGHKLLLLCIPMILTTYSWFSLLPVRYVVVEILKKCYWVFPHRRISGLLVCQNTVFVLTSALQRFPTHLREKKEEK